MPVIRLTDKLYDILDEIDDIIATAIIKLEGNVHIENKMQIEEIDRSVNDYCIDLKIRGKWNQYKIGSFLREFFGPDVFTKEDINKFTEKYNKLKNSWPHKQNLPKSGYTKVEEPVKPPFTPIEVPEFKYNPKDVRSTFISLVTETYPHGHEEEVVPFISAAGLKKDKFGNYYKIIGKSTVMFTSHLDTADRTKSKVVLGSEKVGDDEFIITDGSTILGADDKAGVTIMLYMISHNIPGLYYFFIGEERGTIGSGNLSSSFEEFDYLTDITKCISFDRRNCFSVITEQLGMESCSEQFAVALCAQFNKSGLSMRPDDTGIYTDSASFIQQIQECTNISVGYFGEHTKSEKQNITFLEKLCKASLSVDWESLPVVKKVGLDEDVLWFYGKFIEEFKKTAFALENKLVTEFGKTFIKLEMDEPDVEIVQNDLRNLALLFKNHEMNPDILFDDEFLKVELTVDPEIKLYRKYLESANIDDIDNFDDFVYKPKEREYEYEDEDEDDSGDEISELCYWIRKMYNSHGVETQVDSENYDVIVYVFLDKKEKISKLVKIFDVTVKVKDDMLKDYDCGCELYENKHGDPVLKFEFLSGGDDDDYVSDEEDEKGEKPF